MSLALKALAKVELNIREAREDCISFINNYLYIEDRDASDIVSPFKLWQGQANIILTYLCSRLIILLKARQLGATTCTLAYVTWRILFNPGYSVVALSKKEDDAKELVRRETFMLRYLPRWMIREKKLAGKNFYGPTWEATSLTISIYHPGGEPSTFTAMSSGPDSGRSFTANLVILDEWAFQAWAEDIWSAAYPTINRPTGGQVIGLSTNKRGSFFESIWKGAEEEQNGFHRIFLPWWTDPRRTREWYEASKKALPHSYRQEYPCTPEEAMSAGEGTAFPEFSEMIHVCRPFTIPPWWRRWRSNDPGYADPFAWHWFAVSPDGIVYCYREYTRSEKDERVTYSDQARAVLEQSGDEPIGFTVVGRDAWNRLGRAMGSNSAPSDGKSIIDCYAEARLFGCIEPPRDTLTGRLIRKAIFHEYLAPFEDERTGRTMAKLQIFSTCTALIEALPNLVVDEKNPEKVALDPHIYTNVYDSAGYALVAWSAKQSKKPEAEKGAIQKDKEKLAKMRRNSRHNR